MIALALNHPLLCAAGIAVASYMVAVAVIYLDNRQR